MVWPPELILKFISILPILYVMFQKGQRSDKVTLNIVINGKGPWIDDIVQSKDPLK